MFIFCFIFYISNFTCAKGTIDFHWKSPNIKVSIKCIIYLSFAFVIILHFSDVLIDNIKGRFTILVQILLQMREHLPPVYGHDLQNSFTFIVDWGYGTKQNQNDHTSWAILNFRVWAYRQTSSDLLRE